MEKKDYKSFDVKSIAGFDEKSIVDKQKFINSIKEIIDSILDLEAIYHENYINGLSIRDEKLLSKCKQNIIENMNLCNMYNVVIVQDDVEYGRVDGIYQMLSLPRIKLKFNPRVKDSFLDKNTNYDEENKYVENLVRIINSILTSSSTALINDVYRKYLNERDGFLIKLCFKETPSISSIIEKLRTIRVELKNLSIDEIMITQQFTKDFSIELSKPFNTNTTDLQSGFIAISIINLKFSKCLNFMPCVIELIESRIKKQFYSEIGDSKSIYCKFQFRSINETFISVNTDIKR